MIESNIYPPDGKLYPCTAPDYYYKDAVGSVFEELEDKSGYKETKRCVRVGYADITIYTMDDIKSMARSGQSITIVSYRDRVAMYSTIRLKGTE